MPPKRNRRRGGKKKKKASAGSGSSGSAAASAAAAGMSSEERAAAALEAKARGNAAFSAGDYETARAAFSEGILLDPSNHVLFSNRCAALCGMHSYRKALADAEQCIALAPSWVKGYTRLGTAYYHLGEFESAVRAYARGLAVDASNTALLEGLAAAQARLNEAKEATAGHGEESKSAEADDGDVGDVVVAGGGGGGSAGGGSGGSGDSGPVIGIDLGTTNSCVAVWRDGGVEVIPDAEGNRTTPSIVAFTAEGRLVGHAAKAQASENASNTVYDAKRLIGRRMDEPEVISDVRRFPFEVTAGAGGKPIISVDYLGERRSYTAEEISAMILEHMKAIAERYLGCAVSSAVITVPAYFNDAQRTATRQAGRIAGLNVRRIINEPTAASLAYGLDSVSSSSSACVLVFDLGGGTFDVSLLSIEGGIFEVLATGGHTHLGGEDFDDAMVDLLVKEFKRAHSCGDEILSDKRAMRRLRTVAEKTKRTLSAEPMAYVDIDSLFDGLPLVVTVSRAKFESMNRKPFKETLDTVRKVLADAKMRVEGIDEVVLVGGSTRIPRLQQMLLEFTRKDDLCRTINPDEAVAYGAAVQGAILSGVRDPATSALLLVDVTPLSLGVEVVGKVMSTVIKRNTSIPVKKSRTYTTESDYQTALDISIYEGERKSTDGNNLLGEFTIRGIQSAKRGVPEIEVTFTLSADGILKVTAEDLVTKAKADVTIRNDRGRLSSEEVDRMVADAERNRAADAALLRRVEARRRLEGALDSILASAPPSMASVTRTWLQATREWCAKNPRPTLSEVNVRCAELETRCGVTVELPSESVAWDA